MKQKYLTDAEIFAMETAIYNDDSETLSSLISEAYSSQSQRDAKEIKEIIGTVSKATKFSEFTPNYAITDLGELFNIKHIRRVSVVYMNTDFIINLRSKTYRMSELMEDAGMVFDFDTIFKYYKDNNISMYVNPLYRKKNPELFIGI